MRNVLLLNCGGGEVLNVISWKRAVVLLSKRRASLLGSYPDIRLRTPGGSVEFPAVLSLTDYVVIPFEKRVRLNKKNILIRDNYRCQYCGGSLSSSSGTMDHIIPRSKGGAHIWSNVCAACKSCNTKKDNLLPEEAGMFPREGKYSAPTRARLLSRYLKDPKYQSWKPFFHL